MDSSDKLGNLPPAPAYYHRPFLRHLCLELSPHCPQHGSYLLRPNSHHHHHLQLSPDCPLHGHLQPHCPLHSSNLHPKIQSTTSFPISPNFSSVPLPPNPQIANPNVNNLNSITPAHDANSNSEALMTQDRNEEEDEDEDEDEDEEEFIFVLTDEWKEFFAKSEAKRRLAKKKGKD